MVVELVERLGHSFEYWLAQPLAFLRYCYLHLQEIDRRRRWEEQMSDVDRAWLNAKGFHQPDDLNREQEKLIERASSVDVAAVAYARGEQMLLDFEKHSVLEGQAEELVYVRN